MSANDSTTHHGLITNLYDNGLITSKFLYEEFLKVDRKLFNPHPQPYEDHPYTIGASATISAPNVHAMGADALLPNLLNAINTKTPTPINLLDVASGSGYQTALFGTIIQTLQHQHPQHQQLQQAKVYGIDIHPSLVSQSIENINNCNPKLISSGIVDVYCSDAFRPLTQFKGAPFDFIHSGVCIPFVPLALLTQLKPTGAMISPIQVNAQTNEQNFYHLTRRGVDEIDVSNLPQSCDYHKDIKNEQDFFAYGLKLQQHGNPQDINKFLNTFFTFKSLFGCIYLMAHDNNSVPKDIPAFKVHNGSNQ